MKCDAEDEQAAMTYNSLFREYFIQYATFKRVAGVFLIALLLMITCAAWQLSSVCQRMLWMSLGYSIASGAAVTPVVQQQAVAG
jgi:hypothetical protein